MDKLICTSCGTVNEYRVANNGIHRTAYCTACGSYIKHLPKIQDNISDFEFYFGKHKGRKLSEFKSQEDLNYLSWAYEAGVFKKDWQASLVKKRLEKGL